MGWSMKSGYISIGKKYRIFYILGKRIHLEKTQKPNTQSPILIGEI